MNKKQLIQQKYAVKQEITEEEYNKAKETFQDDFDLHYLADLECTGIHGDYNYVETQKYYHLEFITDADTNMQLLSDILHEQEEINQNTSTIKHIAVFFVVMSILAMLFDLCRPFLYR